MVSIGDALQFVPSAWIERPGNRGERSGKKRIYKRSPDPIWGKVVQIHRAHRWYRVEYSTSYSGPQQECFKY